MGGVNVMSIFAGVCVFCFLIADLCFISFSPDNNVESRSERQESVFVFQS